MKPKNLAQLKRFLQPGVKLKLVKAPYIAPGAASLDREVVRKTSADCWLKGENIPNGQESCLTWNRAEWFSFDEKGFSTIHGLRYEYVDAESTGL